MTAPGFTGRGGESSGLPVLAWLSHRDFNGVLAVQSHLAHVLQGSIAEANSWSE